MFVIASQVQKRKEENGGKNYDKPQLLSKRHTLGTRPPLRRTANKAGTASSKPGRPPLPDDGPVARVGQATTRPRDDKRTLLPTTTYTATQLDRHGQTPPHGSSPAANRQQHQGPKHRPDTTAFSPPTARPIASLDPP